MESSSHPTDTAAVGRRVPAQVWQWPASLAALGVFVWASIAWTDVFLTATAGGTVLAATVSFAALHTALGFVTRGAWVLPVLVAPPVVAHVTCVPGFLDMCGFAVMLLSAGELFVGVPLVVLGWHVRTLVAARLRRALPT